MMEIGVLASISAVGFKDLVSWRPSFQTARKMPSWRRLDARLDTSGKTPEKGVEGAAAKCLLRKWLEVVELIGIEPTTS